MKRWQRLKKKMKALTVLDTNFLIREAERFRNIQSINIEARELDKKYKITIII
jgi:hypothetical protein